MNLRFIPAIFIFISAYSPLAVIFAINDFSCKSKYYFDHPSAILIMLIVAIISIAVTLFSLFKKSSSPPVKVISMHNKSGELVNYSVPYMMSFFVADLSNIKLLISFGFFMCIMFVLSLRTHNLFMNPILAIFKYNLYEVKYERDKHNFNAHFLSKDGELETGKKYRLHSISDGLFSITKIK